MVTRRFAISLLFLLVPFSLWSQEVSQISSMGNPREVFEQRIMPIFRAEQPSSCVQCHLASVDLKDYILPSSEQTFASLRDQGLIDLEKPDQSKILRLIRMGDDDFDKGARLIHARVRESEYQAFAAWILACCADERLVNLPPAKKTELANPKIPEAVIRHGRKGRLHNSFVRNIWSQRLRCFPCHTPHDIQPQQTKALERFEDLKSKYGDRMILFKETPVETMKEWMARSKMNRNGELPLLNLDDPVQSLIVLKPTAKLPRRIDGKFEPPSYQTPVSHMGGLKMHLNDPSYKSFVAWIKDYASIESDEYKTVDQLPTDNWYATKRVLRLREVPTDWNVGTTVQLKVHRWQTDHEAWSKNPIAFTQGTITPRHMVNGTLFLLAPEDLQQRKSWANSAHKFQAGRYLVKIYVDKHQRIDKRPEILLGKEDWVGNVELKHAKWQVGFPKAEIISAKQLVTE